MQLFKKISVAIFGLISFACAIILVNGSKRIQAPYPKGQIDQSADEILSVQATFRTPVPDWSGKHLAFIRAIGPGRRLFIYDFKSSVVKEIITTNEISQVFGWSSDDRFLAFAQSPPVAPSESDEQTVAWVTIFDSKTGGIERLGTNVNAYEGSTIWLPCGQLFYSTHQLGSNYAEKFIVDPASKTQKKVRNYLTDFTLMGSNTGAFFKDGNIKACILDATNYPPIVGLSDFGPHRFDQMRWLRFWSKTSTLLFCARDETNDWRCLYKFDPASHELKQLTHENTYNGQCLGGGFAYVGNTNNVFYLAVRPENPDLDTNLFKNGNIITYATSADGTKLFAVASANTEPPGIWEYNVVGRRLRCLVGGQATPWEAAKLVEPQSCEIRSFDGLEVPYFVVPPVELGNHTSTKKYPLILYLPPATWQFQRAFDLPAQIYANLNCWYVAVNYRGVDGYGKAYSNYQSVTDAAHDAMVVLEKMGQNPNVDLKNVILSSDSSGMAQALDLLEKSPEKWIGVMLHHPLLNSSMADDLTDKTPPLFVVAGSLERSVPELYEFQKAAEKRGFSVQLQIQKDCGHETWSTDQIRETMLKEVDFVRRITH